MPPREPDNVSTASPEKVPSGGWLHPAPSQTPASYRDPVSESPLTPSHEHWILYVFGTTSGALGLWVWVRGALQGNPGTFGYKAVAVGVVAIVIGALLHYRRIRLEPQSTEPEPPEHGPRGRRSLSLGIKMWVAPLLLSWVQVEMFRDPVAMFPFVMVVGAGLVTWGLVQRGFDSSSARRVLGPVMVAIVGIPLGMLSYVLPLNHFTHHLSSVQVWVYVSELHDDRGNAVLVGPDLPMAPSVELVGSGTQSMLEAVASAEKIEATVMPDGSLVYIDDDGVAQPIELTDGAALFERMQAEADAHDQAERTARQHAYAQKLHELRSGGRLFR